MTGFSQRFFLIALLLGAEALGASILFDGESLRGKPGLLTAILAASGAWAVKGIIGFTALFATFAYLQHKSALLAIAQGAGETPFRWAPLGAHTAAVAVFGFLTMRIYDPAFRDGPWNALIAGWGLLGAAAVVFASVALAPPKLWARLIQATGNLWFYALTATAIACVLGEWSRSLWVPATKTTFALVRLLLGFLVPQMVVQPENMRIGTSRFTAVISQECSGLEGIGLLLIFSCVWLILFRHEIRFPQALLVVPAGVVLLYLLNAVRIAALILIGDAGARDIAARGFHSQAGWIAFNSVAFGLSIAASRIPWFSRSPRENAASVEYRAAPYLMPFLAILAAGFLAGAVTGTFEWFYGLRLLAAGFALWTFRGRYPGVDWRFGWRGAAVGTLVFAVWIGFDALSGRASDSQMPLALSQAAPWQRNMWIAVRALAAIVTVPIAEELAFRGFLQRRLIAEDFESVPFRRFTWISVLFTSLAFGMMHGVRWPEATIAGALFGALALRTGRLGEAILAHGVANTLLAIVVLTLGRWDLW